MRSESHRSGIQSWEPQNATGLRPERVAHPEWKKRARNFHLELQSFRGRQQVFFVATPPLSPSAHINVSPKGLDARKVLSPPELGYLDLTGSGNETSAHLLETRRTPLTKWAAVKGVEGLEAYRTEKNEASIDGLATHRARQKQDLPRSPRADYGSRDCLGTAGFRAISSTIAGGLCPRGRVRPVRTNPRPA